MSNQTSTSTAKPRMTAQERKSTLSLGAIFALRMLGLFLILPVFAIYATNYGEHVSETEIGIALGIYGLTQGILQIPYGYASDLFGRKRMICLGLLLFVIGSVISAIASNITWVIVGRALQGAGAVSAVVTALLADSVRQSVLTRAMAVIGSSIGLTFALSLILAPVLAASIGISGIFWFTAIMALLSIALMLWVVPEPPKACIADNIHAHVAAASKWAVIFDPELARLNTGIFFLHMAQMSLFVVVPPLLSELGLDKSLHGYLYLGPVILSMGFMMMAIRRNERTQKTKMLFSSAIALLFVSFMGFKFFAINIPFIFGLLLVFFTGFMILEASLPSLISKVAHPSMKGLALGVFNTTQSLGLFVGGVVGGWLSNHYGANMVYLFCATLIAIWWVIAQFHRFPTSKPRD